MSDRRWQRRIVKKFGGDTFRIIEEEPERLAEVKGISERKAREIAIQVEEKKDMREAMIYLQKYGISTTAGGKDLSALWSERLSRNRRKSISDGRSCAGSWL